MKTEEPRVIRDGGARDVRPLFSVTAPLPGGTRRIPGEDEIMRAVPLQDRDDRFRVVESVGSRLSILPRQEIRETGARAVRWNGERKKKQESEAHPPNSSKAVVKGQHPQGLDGLDLGADLEARPAKR